MRRLASVLALALLLGSCTSEADPDPSAQPSATGAPSSGAGSSSPSPSLSPGEFPSGADVLDIAISEPSSLDPLRIQDPGSVLIARQLFEGLTAWDAVEQEVVPATAAGWSVEKAGRRFVFSLHQGMTFHDGTPVRARDFKFAFDRIAKKSNASALAYLLDRIVGFDEVNQLGQGNSLRGVKAPDDYTLVIEMTEPFMGLPALLTHPALVPLPRAAVANENQFLARPVGNGPFQMAAPWAPGGTVVLQRFDNFISTPSLEGIRFHPFENAADSWIDFVAEEFDVAEVPAGQVAAAADTYGEEGYAPLLVSYSFGMNVRSKALRDLDTRRAINLAIDRQRIADDIYKGTMIPARGIVPTGMPGFESDACEGVCSYDPDAAAALLSGAPGSDKLTVEFTKGAPHDEVARSVARDLEAVGFKVTTKGYPFARYIRHLRSGSQEVYRLGWISEYPSPDGFLDALFSSGSPDNNSGFGSKEVDELLKRAHQEPTADERYELYRRAESLILKKAAVAPIGSFRTHWAAHERVLDIHFDVTGGFDAAPIDLDR